MRTPGSSKHYFITCIFPTLLLKLYIIYSLGFQMKGQKIKCVPVKYDLSGERTTNYQPYLHHKGPCKILPTMFSCFFAPS